MSHTIDINGYTISYDKIGCGPKVAVLIHGWGSSKAWWQTVAAGLAESHTCYLPDLIGFGQSSKPTTPEPFEIEQQVATIAELIQQLKLGPVYLIGHSMGGMISIRLAHQYPKLVERIAVFNLVVTGRCRSFLRTGQRVLRLPVVGRQLYVMGQKATQKTLSNYKQSFRLMLADQTHLKQPEVTAFIERTYPDYRALPVRSFIYALQAFTSFDLRPFMAQVQQPTLVICGREDKQIPPEESLILAKGLPHARLEWFSAGHNPFVEYPEQAIALLASFANGPMLDP